jgi:NADPH:quinone reductase-like Zn-dependent oxidoreductase
MKAIVQESYGSPDGLRLREIETPVVGDDDLLLRVLAASVNAYDCHMTKRLPHVMGMLLRMPRTRVPGVDLAGHVEAVGKNVTRFRPGEEVFGAGIGSFAEYATSSEHRLAPKPSNLTFEQAATFPIAGLTALQGLRDKARLQPGQRVLIYGAGGGVGTFAVQIAKALGAQVTAVSSTRNVDLLHSLGADDVIDYTKADFTGSGRHWDLIVDNVGNHSLLDCRRALTPKGRYVMVGGPKGRWIAPLDRLLSLKVLSWFVSQDMGMMLAHLDKDDLGTLRDLMRDGKVTPVVDRTYPLSQVPEAMRYLEAGHARGKVVIAVSSGS